MAPFFVRAAMMHDDGGQTVHQRLFNLAEMRVLQGRTGYRWDGEGFIGGDVNRLWFKSEGDGAFDQGVSSAEVQSLFSHDARADRQSPDHASSVMGVRTWL